MAAKEFVLCSSTTVTISVLFDDLLNTSSGFKVVNNSGAPITFTRRILGLDVTSSHADGSNSQTLFASALPVQDFNAVTNTLKIPGIDAWGFGNG